MGWMFGWHTRKELAEHLISGNGIVTLRHCFKGNNLWCVHETATTKAGYGGNVRWIGLYLIKGNNNSQYGWGYKDIDESMGPNYHNCPLAYIELVEAHEKANGYGPQGYAAEWRKQVREYWEKSKRKLVPGTKIRLYGIEYTVLGRPYKDGSYSVQIGNGYDHLKLPRRMVKDVEVLA
jgi:hypothetical protein